MFYVSLCEPSKGTLRCYTSICDGIILLISTVQDHQVLVFCQNFWVKDIQNVVLVSPHTKVVMVMSKNM